MEPDGPSRPCGGNDERASPEPARHTADARRSDAPKSDGDGNQRASALAREPRQWQLSAAPNRLGADNAPRSG